MVILFLMVLLGFLLLTMGVVFFLNLLISHDTVNYDMSYLWMEQEYSKEDFDYYR